MRFIDVKTLKTTIPCEICTEIANHYIVFMDRGLKFQLYLCEEHFKDEKSRISGIKRIKNRVINSNDNQFNVLNANYKNVKFKAYYDKETNILHVLDNMGYGAYRSVTNGIDDILDYLIEYFKINDENYRIFLYGTDNVIAEYDEINNNYKIIKSQNPYIFNPFKNHMMMLYNN